MTTALAVHRQTHPQVGDHIAQRLGRLSGVGVRIFQDLADQAGRTRPFMNPFEDMPTRACLFHVPHARRS